MPTPFDVTAPLAGLAIAAVVWGLTYLATVDWIHPHHTNDPET